MLNLRACGMLNKYELWKEVSCDVPLKQILISDNVSYKCISCFCILFLVRLSGSTHTPHHLRNAESVRVRSTNQGRITARAVPIKKVCSKKYHIKASSDFNFLTNL